MKRKVQIFAQLFFLLAIYSCSSTKKIEVTSRRITSTPPVSLYNYKSVQTRNGQDAELALAMSVAGGGSRASNFGKGVLLELENIKLFSNSNALNEIDYFSTVSGGGHVGGAYIASMFQYDLIHGGDMKNYSFNEFYKTQYKNLEFKYKTHPVPYFIVTSGFMLPNRNKKLEKTVDDFVLLRKKTGKSILLSDVFVDSRDENKIVKFPMLVANTTCVENLLRIPFAPNVLKRCNVATYNHRYKTICDTNVFNWPLSSALCASGCVPLIIPPSVFGTKNSNAKYFRLIDGGTVENTGAITAIQILQQEKKGQRKRLIVVEDTGEGVDNAYTEKKYKGVLAKMPDYGINSKYATFYEDLEVFVKQQPLHDKDQKIKLVVLDFRTLLRKKNDARIVVISDNKDTTYEFIFTANYILNKYENNVNAILENENDLHALYEVATHVETKYEATDLERRILIFTGRVVVLMQKENIVELLTGKND